MREFTYLPYLGSIELLIQDAFPGRKVSVWWEKSVFNPRWFEDMDNTFTKIGANHIRAMIKRWRGEKDERTDNRETLINVPKGQDPYSVIGNYILNHVTAIEDMIAVIYINGLIIKELYMADGDADGYFYWDNDWWEGEEDVALLDFFPVSDAEGPERPKGHWIDTGSGQECSECGEVQYGYDNFRYYCAKCGVKMRQDDQSHPFTDDVMMKGESDD